jgi:Ion channel
LTAVHWQLAVGGTLLVLVILWDAFETIVFPRRVTRRVRLARYFYRGIWIPWVGVARRIRSPRRREAFLSFFGPLSLLLLIAFWAVGLILGFALLFQASGPPRDSGRSAPGFASAFYMSGTTFFTLGIGDVTPRSPSARAITVAEAGTGFGFLAVVISYLPVLYGAFSRREVNISLLDARAGSPPSAAELLRRHGRDGTLAELARYLSDWEVWAAELMESHLSYPVLCYYRSQHDNQSWLSALTTILDVSALVIAEIDLPPWQAQMTFAIARHAVVDLAQILRVRPVAQEFDRLGPSDLAQLRRTLTESGVPLRAPSDGRRLQELRALYEPHVDALSRRFLMPLPSFGWPRAAKNNWETSPWG